MKRLTKWLLPAAGLFLLPLALMAQSPSPSSTEGHAGKEKEHNPEARFKRMDKNGDGFVTADEARNPERFQRLLAKADNNPKDGKISKDEFLKARPSGGSHAQNGKGNSVSTGKKSADRDSDSSASGDRQQNPESRFKRMDKNNDGFMTSDEARSPQQFKRLSTKADNNPKDGKISKDEFVNAGSSSSGHSQSSPGGTATPSPK